jgi:hypothetical protein
MLAISIRGSPGAVVTHVISLHGSHIFRNLAQKPMKKVKTKGQMDLDFFTFNPSLTFAFFRLLTEAH